jgi:tetratricopeptide (TPR) repeat protein
LNFYRLFSIGLFALLLTGCAAMGVPETSDPARKLRQASGLIESLDRPIPAERLIRESIDIYQAQQDELGLAYAYRMYGLFFKSSAVSRLPAYYENGTGFMDKTAAFDTRFEKALEYFEKSRDLLLKNNDVQLITNVYAQIAFTYELMNDKVSACNAYDLSLKSDQAIAKSNPELVTLGSREFSSFKQGITEYKKRLGCDT